ncbi:MAG: right-handed parallel beta-helix repeat-containing protein [Phycisphaerales bacterium]|nr:MAG: right-handed parallel beta-helix repeat-containing protein [Phycisphaerales bacterium]
MTSSFPIRVLMIVALGFVALSSSHAKVFYVDPENGDMAGDGSAERPWKTVQEVFEGKLIQSRDGRGQLGNPNAPVKAGDTILLRSGYHGEIYCRGAYNDDYITIVAEKGHKPKVRRVFFAAAGKWIVRGLTVCPEFAPEFKRDRLIYVVDWGGPSTDFVIEDNTLYSTVVGSSWSAEQWNERVCYGIAVIGERIRIRNNKLEFVNHGIVMTGDKITAEGNSIEHIGGDGIVCSANNASLIGNTIRYFYKINANHDDGIQFHRGRDKTTPIRNAVVRGNTVIAWDKAVQNPLMGSPQGICNFDIPAINWRIENNLVLVRHHHGITICGCRHGVIVNNLAYNPYGGNFLAGIALGTTHGKTTSENTVVRNNLVDSKIGLSQASNTADHNIIVKYPERYFRDLDNYDMRHKQGSPAIDAGSAESAPKTDIDGIQRPRGAGIDVGPYEF